ncbi:MAG: formate dehydrogenase-N subunit alpha [Spirochaetota bacterium]
MKITRRNFLKLSGTASAAAFFSSISLSLLSGCKLAIDKLKGTSNLNSICPFCSMGCGIKVSVKNNKIINIEGDESHPINNGRLCAKGSAAFQLSVNEKRLTKVLHRAPFAPEWKEISWEAAIKKIAENIKKTRDKTFVEYEGKNTVNRTDGMAVFAGSYLNNEEYYLLSKMSRVLGIANVRNESDLSHSAADTALANTFGYGAMTNHWIDVQHSDVILIIGSNPAESHPVSVRFMLKAKEKGGRIILADPRCTRTSSFADMHAPLRPGTDIAFIGGIINYALKNNRINKEYLLEYTNAAFMVNPQYHFQNGYFNGFNAGKYNNEAWDYEKDRKGVPRMDKTLKNQYTVFQILNAHFSRYTPDVVSRVTGCPAETFLKIAETYTSTYKNEKAGSIVFSSGSTQHTVGAQNVRAYAILQMLMGNIGIAGGGLYALRNGANSQGADDHGLQPDFLPGYLTAPKADEHSTLESYLKDTTPVSNNPMSVNILSTRNIQIINLLKSFYGETATKENDYCFHWLPKTGRPVSRNAMFDDMRKGKISGLLLAGANPLMNSQDAGGKAGSMENLEWMVATDVFESESAAFWKRQGAKPERIKTEVFLLPSAILPEKTGSLTNAGRWVQWSLKCVNPPGHAKPDLWIYDKIFKEIKMFYAEDKNAAFPDSILRANWDYAGEEANPDPKKTAIEINGYEINTRKSVPGFTKLKEDGSTAAGNWLYSGSFTDSGNMMERRKMKDAPNKLGLYPKWAWSWPGNCRILYNRAGVNRSGKPWNKEKWLMEWDDEWEGDAVNGEEQSGPADKNPFIMLYEGVGKMFAMDMADGPLPEHYEPMESPAYNILNTAGSSPVSALLRRNMGNNAAYPYIASAFNMAEGWQAGLMTKNLTWLSELAPDVYCEISKSLADSRGIKNGDKIYVRSQRGKLTAYCLVTERMRPIVIDGRKIEMVGIIMNSASATIANNYTNLLHDTGDANSGAPECKAFLVNIGREA